VLAVLATACAVPILSGRTRPPELSQAAARRAVDEARRAGASTWATPLLLQAEAALRSGLEEQRRQEVRFILFRDFDTAHHGLRLAREKGRRATMAAVEAKTAARTAADESIEQAKAAVRQAEALVGSIRIDRQDRRYLQEARADLVVAQSLYAAEDYGQAQSLAEQAVRDARSATRGAISLASRYVDREQIGRWRRWIDETIRRSRSTGATAIIVYKEKNLVTLYDGGKPVRSYAADMGQNAIRAKLRAGDNATPEGRYRIIAKKGAGESKYYKALLLDYPNQDDRQRLESARRAGLVARGAAPGGLIEIHGHGGRGLDWTNGCVALSDREMDDIFSRVSVGTPVTIVGGDGRDGIFSNIVRNMATDPELASR
jgi:L,D-peptidoglycan transpeptidase YkuD (ErfK/YbiS/YcfS/YnhG family)